MKKVTFEGTIENAHGSALADLKLQEGFAPLPSVLKYSAEYQAFGPEKEDNLYTPKDWEAALVEMKAAGVVLDAEAQVRAANTARRATARAKHIALKLDEVGVIKPNLENTPMKRLMNVYNTLLMGYTPEQRNDPAIIAEIRATAASASKVDWPAEKSAE